jgi:hypothetical protein
MPDLYRPDLILAPAGTGAADVERLNRVLRAAGLGAALGPPAAGGTAALAAGGTAALAVLPVTGADPLAIRDELRRARGRGEVLPELTPDFLYAVDTVGDHPRPTEWFYYASGKKTGHGAFAWLSAPRYEMPDPQPWPPAGRPPVVALLDSGVEAHDWLPAPGQPVPFCVDAATHGWRPAVDVPGMAADQQPDSADQDRDRQRRLGGYFGHGTFQAGVVRRLAPAAQVLSLRVMDDHGQVSIANVAAALEWLAGREVDVVLMAFGCQPDQDHADQEPVLAALRLLAERQIPVVVSAGNHGSDRPVYPAAYAADPELSVVSVGAQISRTERAPFSNHGVWVRKWRDGSDVLGLMPLTTKDTGAAGYAWWSGTSFAAAEYAAELASGVACRP